MWWDIRAFWLYLFAVLLLNVLQVLAAIAVNHLEIRNHMETIQNRVGVVPGVDADSLLQQMRENMSEREWKQLCETYNFVPRD